LVVVAIRNTECILEFSSTENSRNVTCGANGASLGEGGSGICSRSTQSGATSIDVPLNREKRFNSAGRACEDRELCSAPSASDGGLSGGTCAAAPDTRDPSRVILTIPSSVIRTILVLIRRHSIGCKGHGYGATVEQKKKKHAKAKKFARRRTATKKRVAKKKTLPKKAAPKKTALKKMKVRGKSQRVDSLAYEPEGLGPRSSGQSGDLRGVSNIERADSESVDELLEEGNAFEAEVVEGVQNAGDADEGEVRTHEVPQDDVPDEYLDMHK
jgi:hypothetical protein